MGNRKPFISIITPTYNRKELLEKAILSVINQNKNIPFEREMLITDDGSNDGTKNYIKKYLDKYPNNIKYYYQENAGVGKARNTCLKNLSKISNYTILLDSDDELKPDLINICLKKRKYLKEEGKYNNILGFYCLCEDEYGNVIGNRKILQGKKEIHFDYMSYLRGEINVEMLIILKSIVFLYDPMLKFPENVVTEGVMRSKMWQYMYKKGFKIILWDYVGRFYRINHTSEIRICKTISKDRFKKNALGNMEILKTIGEDMLNFSLITNYGELLFRIGINWILYGEKKTGFTYLKKSLKYKKDIKNILIYLLALINRKIVLFIYKKYI